MYDPDKAINEQYKEINQLKDDLYDETRLREKLAGLLERTANALKGQPEPLHSHDWSDLPKVAAQLKEDLDLHKKIRNAQGNMIRNLLRRWEERKDIKALEEFKDAVLKQYPMLFSIWLDHLRRKNNERRME